MKKMWFLKKKKKKNEGKCGKEKTIEMKSNDLNLEKSKTDKKWNEDAKKEQNDELDQDIDVEKEKRRQDETRRIA